MEMIFNIFQEAYADPLIKSFFWVMFGFFLWGFFSSRKLQSIIISIGIFGTFLGVFLGLYHFDTRNITVSVPELLKSLKLAFATSILGMFFSILLTFKQIFLGETSSEDSTESLLASISKSSENTIKIISSLKDSLNTNLSKIDISLNEALEKMSKGATSEIIRALESVIKDFNDNLQEQFGENFKQLNESVKKMILWQENYKIHIEQVEKTIREASINLNENSNYTKNLIEYFNEIKEIYNKLQNIIETNHNQIENLQSGAEGLKKFGDHVDITNKSIDEFSQSIQKSLSEQSEGLRKLSEDLASSLSNLNKSLTALTDKFREDYKSYLDSLPKKP